MGKLPKEEPVFMSSESNKRPEPFNRMKECRYGTMVYNIHDMYVGRSLDLYGEFSEGECELFRQIIKPGHTVLDVGANIGAHAVFFSQAVSPGGIVLAFEPQWLMFQVLCANVAINSLDNVRCFNAALGEKQGRIRVPQLDPRTTNNFGGLSLGPDGTKAEHAACDDVQVMRIDELGLKACRLIKVDVEGMELTVLKGAVEVIKQFRPALYVEADRNDRRQELFKFIDELGYDMFWHRPALFSNDNHFKNTINVFGETASINVLCVPRVAHNEIAGLKRVELDKETRADAGGG
jgi:FkbM family methyltransferase